MGSSSISSSVLAAATGKWNITSGGSIANADTNPTTFYSSMYLPDGSWASEKTVCDPCPTGWRVPDGGADGVWSKALGSSASTNLSYDSTNRGINCSGSFGDDAMIWYPTSGYRHSSYGSLNNVFSDGNYWSCTSYSAYSLDFDNHGYVNPSSNTDRSAGFPVRCLQE